MNEPGTPEWLILFRELDDRLSTQEFKQALGCCRQTIYRWRVGKSRPGPANQTKIREVHGTVFATEGVRPQPLDISVSVREVADPAFRDFVRVTPAGEIPIPSGALEFVSWLKDRASDSIECLGRFGTTFGRIIVRKIEIRSQIDTFKSNFEALIQNPKASEEKENIRRLALYLLDAWEIEISWDSDEICHATIMWPRGAVTPGQRVCVFAAKPDTLMIFDDDDLKSELRETSREFRQLLSNLSELAEQA